MKKFLSNVLAVTVVAISGMFIAIPTAQAAGSTVYDTPGVQQVNGRWWSTSCEKYSKNVDRCWTYIWGDSVIEYNGSYMVQKDWQFNNLTYLASSRASWGSNPLSRNGTWVGSDGHRWRTECDTKVTGRNGCRTYRMSKDLVKTGNGFSNRESWVFNNIVLFTSGSKKNDVAVNYKQFVPRNNYARVPSPAMTVHSWSLGRQAELDQCKGAISYAGMDTWAMPWVVEHDFCGGSRFHHLKVGNVVKLTGSSGGTYRVSKIRIFNPAHLDNSYFQGIDGILQTCVGTPATTMYIALERIG